MLFQLVSCLSGQRLTEDALYCAGECEVLGDDNLVWFSASLLHQVCLFSNTLMQDTDYHVYDTSTCTWHLCGYWYVHMNKTCTRLCPIDKLLYITLLVFMKSR